MALNKISQHQERVLIAAAKEGNKAAITKLVEMYEPLMYSLARRYMRPEVETEDIIHEGILGLMDAVSRYDHTKGGRFATYAHYRVRDYMYTYSTEQFAPVKISSTTINKAFALRNIEFKLNTKLHRQPTHREVAEETGMTLDGLATIRSINEVLQPVGEAVSSQRPSKAVEHGTALDRASLNVAMKESLAKLSERECEAVRRYYGLGAQPRETLIQIAEGFGLSESRMSQIITKALSQMQRYLQAAGYDSCNLT